LTARRHDLGLEFVAVFTTCTTFDCTHENVHLEGKWTSSGARKWGARWEDWPLTNTVHPSANKRHRPVSARRPSYQSQRYRHRRRSGKTGASCRMVTRMTCTWQKFRIIGI
jgi:hypothetical protein